MISDELRALLTSDDDAIEVAVDAYRDMYAQAFPQGGDEGDHAEAQREGVIAAIGAWMEAMAA